MKVVILAGGFGSRLFEETISKPKPMIEIGGMPLLWHIIKFYSSFNFNEFIILLGYKKEIIVEYFNKICSLEKQEIVNGNIAWNYISPIDNLKIKLVDTGLDTMTAGRLRKVKSLFDKNNFLLSYGDTLSNVNVKDVISVHNKSKAIITLTSTQPRSKYGIINFQNGSTIVKNFEEKPKLTNQWINGGFYVVNPQIFEYIQSDEDTLEIDVFEKLLIDSKISAYKHRGFWKSVETYKDKLELEDLWKENQAAWNIWENKLGKAL